MESACAKGASARNARADKLQIDDRRKVSLRRRDYHPSLPRVSTGTAVLTDYQLRAFTFRWLLIHLDKPLQHLRRNREIVRRQLLIPLLHASPQYLRRSADHVHHHPRAACLKRANLPYTMFPKKKSVVQNYVQPAPQ